jgi:hypothetical protein
MSIRCAGGKPHKSGVPANFSAVPANGGMVMQESLLNKGKGFSRRHGGLQELQTLRNPGGEMIGVARSVNITP